MPILSIDHFEKLHIGPDNSIIGILQSDAAGHRRNVTYMMDSEFYQTGNSAKFEDQRYLYHTESQVDNRIPSSDDGHFVPPSYRRVFYNLYDVRDTAGKTSQEGRLVNTASRLWQLDANGHFDNYCPVLSADPVEFTSKDSMFLMVTRPMNASPLIKTTDLLFQRNEMLSASGKITTTEWAYQISSHTALGEVPTYGYAPLSDVNYPGLHVPVSSLYIHVDKRPLCAALAVFPSETTVATISARINANGALDWQVGELTAHFGTDWQKGLVSGFGSMTLTEFYNATIDYEPSYTSYVALCGGDSAISTLLVNKFNFPGMNYGYIYWTDTGNGVNPFTAGEVWFDMVYGKNAYTSRYSEQFAPDDKSVGVSPGNFNRSREYSGIGTGGHIPFLKYYDDIKYESGGNKSRVTVGETDFSTVETGYPKEGDVPRTNPLSHDNDITTSEVGYRRYPHIEQLEQLNVMVNQSIHPTNLYTIELKQDYIKKLFNGIYEQGLTNGASTPSQTVLEIKTDIQNSIREIARKFAPATTELLNVRYG